MNCNIYPFPGVSISISSTCVLCMTLECSGVHLNFKVGNLIGLDLHSICCHRSAFSEIQMLNYNHFEYKALHAQVLGPCN